MDQSVANDRPGEASSEGKKKLTEQYAVMGICRDEKQQKEVYALLQARGLACRVLTL
ncbi:MAG: hypothetical protein AABZ12_12875 [Planctomycetota bacterium]